jgi:O-antigen ligase
MYKRFFQKIRCMITVLHQLKNNNWFFISLAGFVAVMPFSEALVSIMSGVVLFTALAEDNLKNKIRRVKERRILLFISSVFLIYLLSGIIFGNFNNAVYDLKKNLFFLVIPLAFMAGKEITTRQKQQLFIVFSMAVMAASLFAVYQWIITFYAGATDVRGISLISHIRFSFQVILSFWFCALIIIKNYNVISKTTLIMLFVISLYFLAFVLFQQSLTGLYTLTASILFFIFYAIIKSPEKYKPFLFVSALLLLLIPVLYISWAVSRFYDIEEADVNSIEKTTALGNAYNHYFDDPLVENGRYVYLYVCEEEMREAWNKRSECKYDSAGQNGFPLHATLMRYLTSKGLRKDAEGVEALTDKDVCNIENGISNVIFKDKKFSLYPRIYQTIWEYYVYSKTGYANEQSLSQRIEFAKAAFTIINKNFWFGVGTGNWKDEFNEAYHENSSKLAEKYYSSAHNQYLNYFVKFGITGLAMILFFIVYPVIQTGRYRDIYFLIFLIAMFFANFSDSNLESHMGGSFFVFFYCLYISTDGVDYLKLR